MSIFTKFTAIFAIVVASSASLAEQNLSDKLSQPILKELSDRIENSEDSFENRQTQAKREKVCSTADCLETAKMYAEAMDKNVDPCQNLYNFTCRGSATNTPIFKNIRISHRFQIVESSVHKRLRGMLESAPEVSDILPIQQAKKFYRSCIETEGRRAKGIRTIASILEGNGGWPMAMNLEDWKEDAYSWQEVDEYFARLTGDYTFFDINPRDNLAEDSEDNMIWLKIPEGHSPEFRETYALYLSMVQPIVESFIHHNQATVSAEQLEKDLHDLFVFGNKLLEVKKGEYLSHLHVMKLGSWAHDWDYKSQAESNPKAAVNWHRIIQHIFDPEGIEINDHWHVMATGPYFWSLIEIWNTTDKRTIVNYIHWNFISRIIDYLPEERAQLPRSLQCYQQMAMYHANAFWLVENYFGEATQEAAREMLKNVQEEFKYRVANWDEIEDHSKSALVETLKKVEISLEVPDLYRNRTQIEHMYRGLTTGDDYVTNILMLLKYQKNHEVRSFIEGEADFTWAINLLGAEIIYVPYVLDWNIGVEDEPAPSFEAPYFSPEVPEYVKYATIGVSIARELGKAINFVDMVTKGTFSSEERKTVMLYDQHKNAHCIWNQSDSYFKNEAMSIRAWYEDIVDTIGLQAAFKAYKRLREMVNQESKGEMKLPGFEEFTDEQMFFIVFGGGLCGYRSRKFMGHEAYKHSSPAFRANNRVYNTPEFTEAFNCPLGSPMNPIDKCSIGSEWLMRKG